MLGYLSTDINYLFREANIFFFSESEARGKTVSYEEQIMSKDKYPIIFSPQMEDIIFIILQIFFQRAQFWKLGDI